MATQEIVTGAGFTNNGGTILHAGAIDGLNVTNVLSLADNTHEVPYGSRVFQAVSPDSSGNIGTFKPLSAGVFGKMEAGQYVAKVIGTRIAQTDNTFLRSGAAETSSRRALHYARGNYRYDITDWSYITGAATFGGNRGDAFTYVDPATGSGQTHEPFPTDAVPGELVYMDGSKIPIQDDYKVRTNP